MAADDLTTWANVQAYTGADTEESTFYAFLITAASKWANRFTSRLLASRSYATETIDTLYDGTGGGNYLMLRQYPITAIASVYEDNDRAFGSDTLIAATEYIFYSTTGQLLFPDDILNPGFQNYRVYYTAGYVLASVDEDLENAIVQLVDFWDKSYTGHRFGVSSTGVDDKRIVYEKGVPEIIQQALYPYKKVVMA